MVARARYLKLFYQRPGGLKTRAYGSWFVDNVVSSIIERSLFVTNGTQDQGQGAPGNVVSPLVSSPNGIVIIRVEQY
jgi:hypothetical protein